MKKISSVLNESLQKLKPAHFSELKPEYKCDLCEDRGIIISGGKAKKCSCTKNNSLRLRSLFGEALQKANFDNFDFSYYNNAHFADEEIRDRENAVRTHREAKNFVELLLAGQKPKGLVLMGNVGSGKTHLAAAITNALQSNDIYALFVVVPELLDELRATYRNDGLDESKIMDSAKNSPVLILDDLGAHNYTEWTRNKIFSLLNFRLMHALPTVITTNLIMEEMEEYLGERTSSRVVELCKICRLSTEKDIRFQKNPKK